MVTANQYSLFEELESQRAFEPCFPSSVGLNVVTKEPDTAVSKLTISEYSVLDERARTGTEILEIFDLIKLLGSKYSPGEKTTIAPTLSSSTATIRLNDAE